MKLDITYLVTMRITLRIKKQYLLEIISLNKTEEYRDYTTYYISRFCENIASKKIKFKPIREVCLIAGYMSDSARAVVEVKGIIRSEELDEHGRKTNEFYFTIMLGKVLETCYIK